MSKDDTEFVWLPRAQVDLVFDATAEVECMIELVARELGHEDNEVAAASFTRLVSFIKTIRRANSVAMSISSGEERDFGEMYAEIHGPQPYQHAGTREGAAP